MLLAISILAALYRRRGTGAGEHTEIAMQDAMLQYIRVALSPRRMEHPTAGPFKMPGWPVRFGGRTPEVKPAPLLGQHTNEVLGEWLGLDADQIHQLGKDSII
jgi:crotonobetainyl-CoA:carnitine CoA-transferase CaiB-like acyl-CoA transferase